MKKQGGGLCKRGAYVEVSWFDAHGGDMEWHNVKKSRDHIPASIVTVGRVAWHDSVGITVIMSKDLKKKGADAYLFVPAGCVTSIKELGYVK